MKTKLQYLCILLAVFAGIHQAAAQGTTAFTYQGQLHDGGTNANGTYTMQFKLYDSSGGNNQIGSTITTSPTLANGLFTVNLDFGAGAFNGSARYLDITVTSGATTQTLSPRVQVLPAPYTVYAATANNAAFATNANTANTLSSGTWNSFVGNYQSYVGTLTNVYGIYANGTNLTLELGINTNGVYANSFGFLNGGSISSDGQGGVVISGDNVIGAIPEMQVFNASGDFVVPAGVKRIMVEVWGGGGGGGGAGSGDGVGLNGGDGAGGSGGGYGKDIITVTPGSNLTVTVGSGGTAGTGGALALYSNVGVNTWAYYPGTNGGNGGTSSIGSVTATGGIGGGGGTGAVIQEVFNQPNIELYDGNAGNAGSPGTSTASLSINGFSGGNGTGNGEGGFGGAGANGGAGGGPQGSSIQNGQSPGGGGMGGGGAYSNEGAGGQYGASGNSGAAGRIVIYY